MQARLTHGYSGQIVTADTTWDPVAATLTVTPRTPLAGGPWLVTVAGLGDDQSEEPPGPLMLRFTVGPLPPPAGTPPIEAPTTSTTRPSEPVPAPTGSPGYWMVDDAGHVYAFGSASWLGAPLLGAGARAVDLEANATGDGYWIVDDAGRVYAYGARHFGNAEPARLAAGEKVASLSATPEGDGYWIFTHRGRAVPFGAAAFFGDMSAVNLNGPVLDSISTPTGGGYYMVAADGGVFTFGDARFIGSMGGVPLNAPVQSLVPSPTGHGYWLVAADGGVFAFDAPFRGSMGATPLNRPIIGMVPYGDGYLMLGEDGGAFNFSDLPFLGSLGADSRALEVMSSAGAYDDGVRSTLAQPGRTDDPDLTGRHSFLWALSKPVIAAVNGAAAGLGLAIVCYSDLRFAAAGAKLTTSTSRLGLPVEFGLSWLLPRLVGTGRAAELLLASPVITAEEAERIGLVNRVYPAETLLAETLDYARRMARECAPSSLRAAKEQLYTDLRGTLAAAEADYLRRLHNMAGSPDFAEGVAALVERRPPNFRRR